LKNNVRVIFHIDLNQFFCSVAMLKNPRLKGKAFAIGRENSTKGVISTASYEARKYGVNSGMSLVDAYHKLPSLIVVSYPFELYIEYSKRFFSLLREYVKVIEQGSIDEGYLDVTEITIDKGVHPVKLAEEIQRRALDELGLPCSIGIAPTLFLAKMASDMKKPLGITVLRIRDVEKMLYPLPVKDIFGIGKKTWPRLIENGIKTIGDLMNPNNKEKVVSLIGERSLNYCIESLSGKTNNVVSGERRNPESISHSMTFDTPLVNYDEVLRNVLELAEEVYYELIHENKYAKTIGITLRDTTFKTITRSKSLDKPTNDKSTIMYYIEDLVEENYNKESLRLVGASVSNLSDKIEEDEEITLFNFEDKLGKECAISDLISKYKGILYLGKDMKEKKEK